jgi:protein SCO1/2
MQFAGKSKVALIAFLVFDVFLIAFFVYLYQLRDERQSASDLREIGVTIYPQARAISDFQLIDQHGEVFTKNDFNGHWNLVFFGFTNCPDICPLAMAELKQFYEALEVGVDEKPKIFLVTVDPERDNPDSMKAYVGKYNDDFIGLSGDAETISRLATELYVVYGNGAEHDGNHREESRKASEETAKAVSMMHSDYVIPHSGHIAVISPRGEYYAVMRAPHRNKDIETAYLALVE